MDGVSEIWKKKKCSEIREQNEAQKHVVKVWITQVCMYHSTQHTNEIIFLLTKNTTFGVFFDESNLVLQVV